MATDSKQLIRYFKTKNQEEKLEEHNLVTRVYVQLPIINKVVQEKGIEKLTEFEKVCYLFKNSTDDAILKVIEEDKGMTKAIEKRYHVDAKDRVKQLFSTQVDTIIDFLFDIEDYDTFKTRVEALS